MKKKDKTPVTRRAFVKQTASIALGSSVLSGIPLRIFDENKIIYQAMGTRVGEVTDTSAIIWTRLTSVPVRNNKGVLIPGRMNDYPQGQLPVVTVPVEQLEGACPGVSGFVRVRYGVDENLKTAQTTEWVEVSESTDFIHHFTLEGLKSDTTYYYESEATTNKRKKGRETFKGKFGTAPAADTPSNFRFCLMTCQGYPDRGHPDGHNIYPAMLALKPKFTCLTGDLVYYDNDMPRAFTERLARYHWERMFSLPRLMEFNRNVGTYWLKDDHDTLDNDSEPGAKMGDFTFAQGQNIFYQQAPMYGNSPSYRTFRWGQDLQIWLTDGRDFRSPNEMPDGPEKTIWGKEQKEWFQKTVKESTTTWKVLVSPTPLVGPDRPQKDDNHTNKGFKHEGDELRNWLQANVPDNFFVICGDRHWQYHSVHPETGLNEFSIGAASDEHAGGTPGENKAYHRFHLVKGGFLSVDLKRIDNKSSITFQHHDIHGAVVYEWKKERTV
ncbi:alkaline phosphatase D family protein [Runella sp.]|jgi:alkaline phosphatase D|uniref:alkaline phosphatase D family protein n=1 Tax=Runella sp. TaxID=1960881 RepID=UPI0026053A21|nr:alkaline phosphatase D family protein [Runella sp.]